MANEIEQIPMMEPLVVDLNNDVLQEANEWAERSSLVRIFWSIPVPLQAVRATLDDVWKCRGELNIFEAGFGLYQFIFPSVHKRNWVLKTQPWSFQLSIMNMMRFVAPSENLFNQLQFMNISVKLAGIPIDCRTLVFGRQMLEKIGVLQKVNFFIADSAEGFFIKGLVRLDILGSRAGRITARFSGGRSFFVYFQYIQVQAICFQCGIIGHTFDFCPHQHLTLDLEARNKWMCIPDCGKLVEGPNLQKKSTTKYQSRRGAPLLPPSVMASFAAAISSSQDPEQGKTSDQGKRKGDQLSPSSALKTLENASGTIGVREEVGSIEIVREGNSADSETREPSAPEAMENERSRKRKKACEDKRKATVVELEKDPKKLLRGNKGIVIRALDEEALDERVLPNQKDKQLEEGAVSASRMEGKKVKDQVSASKENKNNKASLVKDPFGKAGAEISRNWSGQELNDEDEVPWMEKIDTYGSNEGTFGDLLRKEDGLDKEN